MKRPATVPAPAPLNLYEARSLIDAAREKDKILKDAEIVERSARADAFDAWHAALSVIYELRQFQLVQDRDGYVYQVVGIDASQSFDPENPCQPNIKGRLRRADGEFSNEITTVYYWEKVEND